MAPAHRPVMLAEVLAQLEPRAGGVYVDATYGRGGHARALLERAGPDCRLLAFDRDPDAVAAALEEFGTDARFTITRGSFAMLERTVDAHGLAGAVDGVVADLGVSSPQLDEAARGFSFAADGPLDMRMDPSAGVPASQWLAEVPEAELARVLKVYGEERFARRVPPPRGAPPPRPPAPPPRGAPRARRRARAARPPGPRRRRRRFSGRPAKVQQMLMGLGDRWLASEIVIAGERVS
jgi:16S rRNA (cytosine(1402)-N(4))-methyltransferase